MEPTSPPPTAPRIPRLDVLHGDRREDDYFWLRRKDDPEVTAYLEAENAYAEAVLKPTEPFQEALYAEMLARIKEDDQSVPYRRGRHFYYSRTEKGKQYPIYCRKTGGLEAPEEVVLDLNALAEGHSFLSLGVYTVSDDDTLLAYSLDYTGFREYTLFVKDLGTGALLPDRVEKVSSVAWAADAAVVFYVTEDHAKRPYRLLRHRLGADPDEDARLYEETDELFRLGVWRSRSRAFVFAGSRSFTSAETRYLSAADPTGTWRMLAPREKDHEYDVDHGGDFFYIRTNGGGRRNFRLVRAPVSDPGPERWEELIPHRETVMLEELDVFADHYVAHEREDGLVRLRVTSLRDGGFHHVQFPEPTYDVSEEANAEFDAGAYRLRYESLITPPSVYDYDVAERRLRLLKRSEVLGGYDPTRYRSERLHATAPDGTRVPISLVSRAGTPRDGSSPLALVGYGAYGIPYPVLFSSNRLSLLERGVSVAIAHIRGGGELGKRWHDQGRMLAKGNTFTDFIAVAEFLIAEGWTAADRLTIEGGSAGGLLVGAVLNMRPELFRAAVLRVPFVDVINTMLDESLPLTVGEFEEWGNPKIREHYEYMKRYCPYTNAGGRRYPAMLLRTSLNDSQVMYWEPAKYVAKLRATASVNGLLLKTNMDAGHGGASGRYDALRESAFDYAFILTQLGRATGWNRGERAAAPPDDPHRVRNEGLRGPSPRSNAVAVLTRRAALALSEPETAASTGPGVQSGSRAPNVREMWSESARRPWRDLEAMSGLQDWREIEARPGYAGARRARGAWGGPFEAPHVPSTIPLVPPPHSGRDEIRATTRHVTPLMLLGNLLGAVLMWGYFRFVDVAALSRHHGPGEIVFFVVSFALLVAVGFGISRRWRQPLRAWRQGRDGVSEARVRRLALTFPYAMAALTLAGWTLAGVAWGVVWPWLLGEFSVGQAVRSLALNVIAGSVATAFTFFSVETLWRRVLPVYFPRGDLSATPGVPRVRVRTRLTVIFLLVSVLPLTVLGVLAYTRASALIGTDPATAAGRLDGLLLFILFMLVVGGLVAIGLSLFVSRSVAGPLRELEAAMREVEGGNLQAHCLVVSNDEIGAVTEGFNRMVGGLRERELIRETFGKYVTQEVRDEILSGRVDLEGQTREVTILFADIRDFTPWVEAHDPREVVRDLNAYFTLMEGAIREHHGLVLQYIGDEIEAVFGAPVANPRHPELALRAALEMRRRLAAWNADRARGGRSALRHGIGIHTGRVLAGNIGSPDRLSWTLVGDPVNVAARLQALNKDFGSEILLSGETARRLEAPSGLEPLSTVTVKGKATAVEVYRVC